MDQLNKQQLHAYVSQYGRHCMAYSTLQPGLRYEVLEGVGYIAYLFYKNIFWARKGINIVLADPICDAKNYQKIVTHFIDKFSNVIFIQSSDALAAVLSDLGYEVNQFGIETELPIQDFSLKGKQSSKLRQWRNKCQREKVEVVESPFDSSNASMKAVKELSREWIKRKGGHELTMLTRPLCFESEPDVRYFQAFQKNKLIACAVFDPLYVKGEVVGYYHNIDRISHTAPHGTGAFMLLQALELFKEEGKNLISLGMSPLYAIKRTEYNYNDFFHDALFFAYKNLEFLYPFKGNASHKKKFNGLTKRVFFCSTQGNNLWQLLIALKAIKLF